MKEKLAQTLLAFLSNRVYFLLVLMVVVVAVMSSISPYFFDITNLLTMTRLGAVLALIAMGQSLVILAGGAGIDLSVGGILSLTGVLFGLLAVRAGLDLPVALLLGVLIGAGLGALNGITVAWWGVPPLIGTLGSGWAYSAIALVITQGVPVSGFVDAFRFLGEGSVLGIPAQIMLVVLPAFLLLQMMMARTVFGRWIYLIGVNDQAARFSGVPVTRIRFLLYTLSGLLAGLGAVVMSSWLMAARPDVGAGMELQSITVAVLGGIDIFGGTGSLLGTILAVLIVTMVASGLQLANINAIWQLAVLGFILLGAVALNQILSRQMAVRQGLRV
ncbi:MAG: ABC transporter permease [Caldilineaceae bacterium]|nr:ABC transporter permease [Caldilineaceae bacterium]